MMKNLKTALFSLLAGAMMCACSSDKFGAEPEPTLPDDNGEGFYMGVDIQMPDGGRGSRSSTIAGGLSSGGTEVGSDAENTVTTALLVLASTEANPDFNIEKYGFIAASEIQNNRIADKTGTSTNKRYKATARIQKTNLSTFYDAYQGAEGTNPLVYVFVFCNPTKELVDFFTDGSLKVGSSLWIDATCTVIQGSHTAPNQNIGIWGSNSFLMNNESITTRALPASLQAWEKYNSYDKAFHLSEANDGDVDNSISGRGPVRVERSVARFDFRDASVLGDNTYEVLYTTNEDGTANTDFPMVNVQLQKMCLVNMSNCFYYLPRVSHDGTMTGDNYELCGPEEPWGNRDAEGNYTGGNYVVGPYSGDFSSGIITKDFDRFFNFAFFENDGSFNNNAMTSDRWDVVKIDDILKNNPVDDNYNPAPNDDTNKYKPGYYKVWRYVTENVIPAGPERQRNGISTGVVFKAQILGSDKVSSAYKAQEENWNQGFAENLANCLNDKEFIYNGKTLKLKGNSHNDPILYYMSGNLYMGWRHIRQAAIQAAGTVNVSGKIEFNRSNSLYKAVFGDGPIPPTYTIYGSDKEYHSVYINDKGETIEFTDKMWDSDVNSSAYKAYLQSADYAWMQWNGENKPVGGDGSEDETVPAELKAFREKATDGGITIFQSSLDDGETPGYYCYYYYWNRHNDNGLPGVMCPMEFDVVRNNVYKLSVDKVSRLGHPRIPDNDPDQPKPQLPDESDLIYLDVQVRIAPWAVRVNGIQF